MADKPSYIPRGKGRPPAATFEPERWSKSWKVGKDGKQEGDAVYGWVPPRKSDSEVLLSGLKSLLPKKKTGRIKRAGDYKWQDADEDTVIGKDDLYDDGKTMTGPPAKALETPRKKFPIVSGTLDLRKK